MIKTKVFAKAKSVSSATITTGGVIYSNGTYTGKTNSGDKTTATSTDDIIAKCDNKYLSKLNDDNAAGNITFEKTTTTRGAATFQKTLTVSGLITAQTGIESNGIITANSAIKANDTVTVQKTLTVQNDITGNANIVIAQDAAVDGNLTLGKDADIKGNTYISKNLNVTGVSTLEALLKAKTGLTVADTFKFDKDGNIIAYTIKSKDYIEENKRGYTVAIKDKDTATYKLNISELHAWAKAQTAELVVSNRATNGNFVSGFLGGKGWGIYSHDVINAAGVAEEKWTAEFDNLVIRGGLKVYEMVISQLVGENDNRVFTGMLEVDHYDPATGKVYLSTDDGQTYNPFRKDDYIMVQRFSLETGTGDVVKQYELIVTDYGSEGEGKDMLAWVTFKNFTTIIDGGTPDNLITEGDTFVRMDNLTDTSRKGIIQIISVGANAPYMDVLHGLKTDPDNALKVRLGNLAGITHPNFGTLYGFGAYLQNMFAVGDFVLARTGESIDTKIQILENKFATRFATTEDGLTADNNYLYNGQFILAVDGSIDGWNITNDNPQFYIDESGLPVVINGAPTIAGLNKCTIDEANGKNVLHIQTDGETTLTLTQSEANIKEPTYHEVYSETDTNVITQTPDTMYLSFKVKTAGKSATINITAGAGITATYTGENTEWKTVQVTGTWNGGADAKITVTGDLYITDLMLTNKPLEDLKTTYSTAITQTSKKIELQTQKISNNEEAIAAVKITADTITNEVHNSYAKIDYVDGKETTITQAYTTLIEQTATSITSTAKSYTDEQLTNYSTIEQTDTAITAKVTDATNSLQSTITQTSKDLTAAFTEADTNLSAQITASAEALTAKFENYATKSELTQTADSLTSTITSKENALTSKIEQNAANIALKVAQTDYDNDQKALLDTGIDIANKTVTITADKFTIQNNSGEKVLGADANGNLTVTGTINAQSGQIADFAISNSYIGISTTDVSKGRNQMGLSNHGIIFNGEYVADGQYRQVAIGCFTVTGYDYLGKFTDTKQDITSVKHGVAIEVSGGYINKALEVKGGIYTDKLACYDEFEHLAVSTSNIQLSTPASRIIKFAQASMYVILPKLSDVRTYFALASTDTFAVRMTIICSYASVYAGNVYGRPEDGGTLFGNDSSELPYICGINAYINGSEKLDLISSYEISHGDQLEFLLAYDGTQYVAYELSHRY